MRIQIWALILILGNVAACLAQTAPKRLAPPSPEQQAETRTVIREVYRDDYAKAVKPEQKGALAEKLLADALATKDAPVDRYVLLCVARDLAAQANNLDVVRKAIGALGEGYQVDAAAMRVEALEKLASAAGLADLPPLLDFAAALVDELQKGDHFTQAKQAAAVHLQMAERTKDVALRKRAGAQLEALKKMEEEYAAVLAAKATLEKSPTDEGANLVVGKFFCFFKQDWKQGLPMLALGSDVELAKLSQQELSAATPAARIALADDWYSAGEKQQGDIRILMRRRAYDLYRANAQNLSGIAAKKVDLRLEELDGEFSSPTAAPKVEILHVFPEHSAAAISPDNRFLVTADKDGLLHLWNLQTLRDMRQFKGHAGKVFAAAFTADGERMLTVGGDNKAKLWDVKGGAELRSFDVKESSAYLWLAADGKRCQVVSRTLRSYDVERGKLLKEFDVSGGENEAYPKSYSADGRFVVVSGITNTVRVFDLARGSHIKFDGRTHCYGNGISADGRFALTAGGDNMVRAWSVANAGMVAEYKGAAAHQYAVAMSPDGKRIVSGGGDKRVHVWDAKSGERLHTYACDVVIDHVRVSPSGQYATFTVNQGVWLLGLP